MCSSISKGDKFITTDYLQQCRLSRSTAEIERRGMRFLLLENVGCDKPAKARRGTGQGIAILENSS
jgi:hypothetical protein